MNEVDDEVVKVREKRVNGRGEGTGEDREWPGCWCGPEREEDGGSTWPSWTFSSSRRCALSSQGRGVATSCAQLCLRRVSCLSLAGLVLCDALWCLCLRPADPRHRGLTRSLGRSLCALSTHSHGRRKDLPRTRRTAQRRAHRTFAGRPNLTFCTSRLLALHRQHPGGHRRSSIILR